MLLNLNASLLRLPERKPGAKGRKCERAEGRPGVPHWSLCAAGLPGQSLLRPPASGRSPCLSSPLTNPAILTQYKAALVVPARSRWPAFCGPGTACTTGLLLEPGVQVGAGSRSCPLSISPLHGRALLSPEAKAPTRQGKSATGERRAGERTRLRPTKVSLCLPHSYSLS